MGWFEGGTRGFGFGGRLGGVGVSLWFLEGFGLGCGGGCVCVGGGKREEGLVRVFSWKRMEVLVQMGLGADGLDWVGNRGQGLWLIGFYVGGVAGGGIGRGDWCCGI